MSKYRIVSTRDFGHSKYSINGEYVDHGFEVTDGICNVMPGGAWFGTVEQAMYAIEVMNRVNGDWRAFWASYE